jgi:hypothetical protein
MSDIELPARKGKHDPLTPEREHIRLSPGAYFTENKALVDARRAPLDRLGMDPRHVTALQMPTTEDRPLAVLGEPAVPMPVEISKAEDAPPLDAFSPKKLPRDLEEAL